MSLKKCQKMILMEKVPGVRIRWLPFGPLSFKTQNTYLSLVKIWAFSTPWHFFLQVSHLQSSSKWCRESREVMEVSEDQNYVENVRNLLQNVTDAFPGNKKTLKQPQNQPKIILKFLFFIKNSNFTAKKGYFPSKINFWCFLPSKWP